MIEDMEVELTELSEANLKTDNLAVTAEIDVDESIPIYLKNKNTSISEKNGHRY